MATEVPMKTLAWIVGLVMIVAGGAPSSEAQDVKKFGDAAFIGYEGAQTWPTAGGAQIVSDFAVPIYYGLPNRPYKVLGRVYDDRTGVGVMGRAFSELFSERDRQRDSAEQARYRGGNALVVTNDARIIKALGLTPEDVARTAPLLRSKDSVALVVKFD
jgi:hypothetical protein